MSITVTAVKARQNLGELLNLVSIKHEEVIIERAGKKIARLTAIEDSTVSEPVAQEYAVKTKSGRVRKSGDLADIPEGAVPDRPDILDLCGLGQELWENKGVILTEDLDRRQKEWAALSDEEAKKAVQKFRSIRGVGKEMWEATGLTPDEYIRREREEWD